jgi:hypothetical protein
MSPSRAVAVTFSAKSASVGQQTAPGTAAAKSADVTPMLFVSRAA